MLFTRATIVASAILAQLASASPLPTPTQEMNVERAACPNPLPSPPSPPSPHLPPNAPVGKKPSGPAPAQPLSGDATELPSTNHTLAYVAIGRGIQNYTCSGAGATGVQMGALATLFDATQLAYSNMAALNALPAMAVNVPLPSPGTAFNNGGSPLPVLGHHYFDINGTPSFDLSAVNMAIYAAKINNIKAPVTASKGPAGTGAVDWLYLTAKGAPYTSVGLTQVYRLETAGGIAPICQSTAVESVQYAAEYWFY